jgi:hypothetical protein
MPTGETQFRISIGRIDVPKDAIYPTSEGSNILEPYTGAKKYVMHFQKGKLPPARGF